MTDVVKREFPDLKGWRGSMAPNAKPFVEQILKKKHDDSLPNNS